MVVLSTLGSPLRQFSNDFLLFRFQAIRTFAIKKERPAPAKIQLPPPGDGIGHWKYERDYSNDLRYSKSVNKYKIGQTFFRFFAYNTIHHKELWAILGLMIMSTTLVFCIAYVSMGRIELWLDRSTSTPPWDWARVRDKYWKLPTIVYDPSGGTHLRLGMMEQLQDKMLEASIERGTRDAKGYWVEKKK
ncbi:hypothetical protein GPALN_006353 [Globodera pallida]|uniref:Cytochrome c oxidase subunit ApiCOX24 n=1 Tax=Globodera pallida TaxID=36090 RepID=A0A183CJI0_GLOPA|nr:hypothetical protein GPALN_006353 [Globodera pallida]